MHFIQLSSQVISFYRRITQKKNRKSWVQWRGLVEDIYGFDLDPNQIDLLINIGKNESKKIFTYSEFSPLSGFLSKEELINTLSLIKLYVQLEERNHELPSTGIQSESIQDLLRNFTSDADSISAANSKVDSWLEDKQHKRLFSVIKIPSTLSILFLDFILRWLILGWLNIRNLEPLNGFLSLESNGWFMIFQFIIIPFIVISFSIYRDRKIKKKIQVIFDSIHIKKFKPKIIQSPWNYAIAGLMSLNGVLVFGLHDYFHTPWSIAIYFGVISLFYLVTLLRKFSLSMPSVPEIVSQVEYISKRQLKKELSVDENDEEIVNVEVNLRSVNERMNAFVLEAALFGALAFSGFLQIISSDYFSIKNIEEFTLNTSHLLKNMVNFNFSGNNLIFKNLSSKEGIFSLMSFESLFCSVFFLSVISSRMRFSFLTDFFDKALQLSRSYNKKEEDMIVHQKFLPSDEKVMKFNRKIRDQIEKADNTQEEIIPIMDYMSFFRTLGISTFFIILITGGLFISPFISFILLILSLLSVIYFRFESIFRFFKSLFSRWQEIYFSIERTMNWTGMSLLLLIAAWRSFGAETIFEQVTLVAILFFFSVHFFASAFMPERIDMQEFKDDPFKTKSEFKLTVHKYFKVGLSLFFFGYAMRVLDWRASGGTVISGILMLTFCFLFNKKTEKGHGWLGKFSSFMFLFAFLAIIFKLFHWTFNEPLLIIATFLLLSGVLFNLIYKNIFRKNIFISNVVFVILIASLQNDFLTYGIRNLRFNYTSYRNFNTFNYFYERFLKAESFEDMNNKNSVVIIDSLRTNADKLNRLLEAPDHLFTAGNLNEISWKVYETYSDSILINHAIKWSRKSIEWEKNRWEFMDTHGSLLYKAGRYEEAKRELEKAIRLCKLQKGDCGETEKLLETLISKKDEHKIHS